MTQAEAGKRLGVTQGRVSQIALDGTDSLKIAMAIEGLTSGRVTVRELLRGNPQVAQ